MRTKEQIANLRNVLGLIYGPAFGLFISDEMVDNIANNLQHAIDGLDSSWVLKIKMEENKDKNWEDIKEVSAVIVGPISKIEASVIQFLASHKDVLEVQILEWPTKKVALYLKSISLSRK